MRIDFSEIIQKTFFCLVERRLPLRFIQGKRLVSYRWYKRLESQYNKTSKITVGFGPIVSSEHDLHIRKWRIDPIVNCINEIDDRYYAGIFFNADDMLKFDLCVVIREVNFLSVASLRQLKKRGKILIYDIVDSPYCVGGVDNRKILEVMKQANGIIASSPLQYDDFAELNKKMVLIEHPVINTLKKNYEKTNNRLMIIWQGFPEHLPRMETLKPIVRKLGRESRAKIILCYHTKILPKKIGSVHYRAWTVRSWEKMLVQSDIGVEIKLLQDAHLQRKPSTKVISYMAAGLPVICTPSAADRLVIEHGRTGYFAHTAQDWYNYLKTLADNSELRKEMGQAARDYVCQHFSIQKITQKYLNFFDALIKQA